jgi:hypothetical protein
MRLQAVYVEFKAKDSILNIVELNILSSNDANHHYDHASKNWAANTEMKPIFKSKPEQDLTIL